MAILDARPYEFTFDPRRTALVIIQMAHTRQPGLGFRLARVPVTAR